MLITIISWCIITFLALSMGMLINLLFKGFFHTEVKRVDMLVITGLMGLTVYAGIFSLFYKVGAVAVITLTAFFLAALFIPGIRSQWSNLFSGIRLALSGKIGIARVIITVILLLGSLYIACGIETFYDTELYHGQAIRWIEEYGIVKGLGLLHSRFAYNSCFMSLQALFGFRWLFGLELHSVNAYCAFILSMWAIQSLSLWKDRSFRPADGLKCVQLIFTWIFQLTSLSSPNSDFLALSMAVYIVAGLCDAICDNLRGNDSKPAFECDNLTGQFILYSLLAVYAVSLKLSVCMIVLVAVYPAIVLIRNKQWKQILLAIFCGLVIIFPYIARSIIISGYLIYPYSQIDIFDVTWKMSKSLVDYDRTEIMVWGKSLNDAALADYSITQWLPIWWGNVPHIWRRILEASFILIFAAFIKCAIYLFRKNKTSYNSLLVFLYSVSAAMLAMWFLSAPLLRYGAVFALMIPGIFAGDILSILINKIKVTSYIGIFGIIATVIVCIGTYIIYLPTNSSYVIMPAKYQDMNNREYDYDGLTIYYAADGTDWVGYNDFPAVPYEPDPNYLGIRDVNDLSKGFWNAEIYKSMDSTELK